MSAIEYLQQNRIDELERELREKGYTVERDKRLDDVVFDLFAERGHERLVYEVKAKSKLEPGRSVDFKRLREVATRHGIHDFRISVVNPPHETHIEVDGLEGQLSNAIESDMPASLQALATTVRVEGISNVEVDAITIDSHGTLLGGSGIIEVELEYGGGSDRDGTELNLDFPFAFEVLLDDKGMVKEVSELEVDVSSFYE